MCCFNNTIRIGPLDFEVVNDQDNEHKEIWELEMNPEGGQLWNIWWYQDNLYPTEGQSENAWWYQVNLPTSPSILEEYIDTGFQELSDPPGEVFDIPGSDREARD